MSSPSKSSIRVSGSKNPWNKKKNKKPNQTNNNTIKQSTASNV